MSPTILQGQGAQHDNLRQPAAGYTPAAPGVEQAGPPLHGHRSHGLHQSRHPRHQVMRPSGASLELGAIFTLMLEMALLELDVLTM